MSTQGDALLPLFLRNLADEIEKGKVSDSQIQRTGEFYMSYLFHQEAENDSKTLCQGGDAKTQSMSDEDFRKFMFMGYYIYSQISKGNGLN